jgi:putative ABC transport system permease protein
VIRHLLKLAWHRKRANALLLVEIAASFLVVFAVGAFAVYYGGNWMRPLGYDWKNVWAINIADERSGSAFEEGGGEAPLAARLLDELRTIPGIEAAAGMDSPPYVGWTNVSNYMVDGRLVEFMSSGATPGADRVLGLRVVAGRWFTSEDDAAPWLPVVIDQDLAHEFFGTVQCIGKWVPRSKEDTDSMEPGSLTVGRDALRVVGVVDEFRKDGELAAPGNFLFSYVSADAKTGPSRAQAMIVRVPPGATVALEEQVVNRLRALAPQWSFDVRPLAQLRASAFWEVCTPLILLGTIASFLLLMVTLGLIGVLWQNVARRTRELGLRRAMGATRLRICRQVLGEQILITAMAMLVGTVVVVQLPFFDPFEWVPGSILAGGLLAAVLTILSIGLAAGLYPSWITTRIHPAEALHHD